MFNTEYKIILLGCVAMVFSGVAGLGGPKGDYSNEWILKSSSMSGRDVESFAKDNGFVLVRQPTPGGYSVLTRTADYEQMESHDADLKLAKRIKAATRIEYLEQLRYLKRYPRGAVKQTTLEINDAAWDDMWHAGSDQFPSQGIYNTWMLGYTGAGVRISILDDGVEPDHPDLVDNYDDTFSYDYLYESSFVNQTDGNYHGTWCAGIASATKNDECVLGMAHGSSFSAVKIFDSYYGLNDYGESEALVHELANIDIYSNSWGPSDNGEIFEAPGPMAQEAIVRGITEGRNGKGVIYTWAGGNGGTYDDCNCDGYAGSMYTISVTSIGRDQGASWYSEQCTSILAGTYSGDSPDLRISTTDIGGMCTDSFQGTSASCPMAAGIIALALEANPDLGWRDVQHLIVATSSTDGLIEANWQTNGAGLRVSHTFGFGIMNAEAMVGEAATWTNVGAQAKCSSGRIAVDTTSDNGVYIVSNHVTDGCGDVEFLEHVEVWMDFTSDYRGSLQITLTSPHGTRSRLLRPRRYDTDESRFEWTFMTVLSWGEVASGTWTLQMETIDSSTVFRLSAWELVLYGTKTAPEYNPGPEAQTGTPTDGDDDSTCYIVAGVLGGVALFSVAAVATYLLVIKKTKDTTVFPSVETSQPPVSH